MKRLAVASLLLLSQFGNGYADGAYDGEWTGSARATSGRCKPAVVTLTVLGEIVLGQARFEVGAQDIRGTVSEDGALGATIGFQHLTGEFIPDSFEGTFNSLGCAWKIALKRTK
jgi:hypothetical protein